jgi:hypothetical protein
MKSFALTWPDRNSYRVEILEKGRGICFFAGPQKDHKKSRRAVVERSGGSLFLLGVASKGALPSVNSDGSPR